jgi:hypothetical protein
MLRAVDLLRQGRNDEIWEMCCGYLNLDIVQFMAVQKRLLLGQLEALNKSKIGKKVMGGVWPQTVDDFRQMVPISSYDAYCPELLEKREDTLPDRPLQWVHTSGKSGEYSCKWIPVTAAFINQLSAILYGIGLLSSSKKYGDTCGLVERPNMIYTVAPRPYMSGALASMIEEQTPLSYFPSLSEAEKLTFEERVRMGFDRALSSGVDYFFGLSVVLTAVGDKFNQSTSQMDVRPFLTRPRALVRLAGGMVKSRMAGRHLLPKDLWKVRGIVTSGLDSSVYKDKIKEYWGRYPLDIYANTEGGVIATQTWDYEGMTFVPNLNFLEFIPEKEHFKWQLDHKYQPKTVLLDEVQAGECYEIIISNFHGGAMVRYRVGDMIRITSLKNDNLGIDIPQMVFERRADDLLDFATIRLSEKTIWKAIERIGLPYQDWVAFKKAGDLTLNLLIEPNDGRQVDEVELEKTLYNQIMKDEIDAFATSQAHRDAIKTTKLEIKVNILPQGTFAKYTAQRRAEGADLAHLKPPHVNPPPKVLSSLLDAIAELPAPAVPVVDKGRPVSVR